MRDDNLETFPSDLVVLLFQHRHSLYRQAPRHALTNGHDSSLYRRILPNPISPLVNVKIRMQKIDRGFLRVSVTAYTKSYLASRLHSKYLFVRMHSATVNIIHAL